MTLRIRDLESRAPDKCPQRILVVDLDCNMDEEKFNEAVKEAEVLVLTADVEKNRDVQSAHRLAEIARAQGLAVVGVLGSSKEDFHSEVDDKIHRLRDSCSLMILLGKERHSAFSESGEMETAEAHAMPDAISLVQHLQPMDRTKSNDPSSTSASGQIMVASYACSNSESALLEATSRAASLVRKAGVRTSGKALVRVVSQNEVASNEKEKVVDIVRDSTQCNDVVVLTGIDESATMNEARVIVLLTHLDGSVGSIRERKGVFDLLDLDPDEGPEESIGIDLNLYQLEDL